MRTIARRVVTLKSRPPRQGEKRVAGIWRHFQSGSEAFPKECPFRGSSRFFPPKNSSLVERQTRDYHEVSRVIDRAAARPSSRGRKSRVPRRTEGALTHTRGEGGGETILRSARDSTAHLGCSLTYLEFENRITSISFAAFLAPWDPFVLFWVPSSPSPSPWLLPLALVPAALTARVQVPLSPLMAHTRGKGTRPREL